MSQQERQPVVTENGNVSVSFHFSIYVQSHRQTLLCDCMRYPFMLVLAVKRSHSRPGRRKTVLRIPQRLTSYEQCSHNSTAGSTWMQKGLSMVFIFPNGSSLPYSCSEQIRNKEINQQRVICRCTSGFDMSHLRSEYLYLKLAVLI